MKNIIKISLVIFSIFLFRQVNSIENQQEQRCRSKSDLTFDRMAIKVLRMEIVLFNNFSQLDEFEDYFIQYLIFPGIKEENNDPLTYMKNVAFENLKYMTKNEIRYLDNIPASFFKLALMMKLNELNKKEKTANVLQQVFNKIVIAGSKENSSLGFVGLNLSYDFLQKEIAPIISRILTFRPNLNWREAITIPGFPKQGKS